jgi:hypothetical protein
MRTLTRPLILATVLVAALLLSACGSDGEDVASTGTDGDTPVSSDATTSSLPGTAPTVDGATDVWTPIEPTTDLVGANVAAVDEIIADPDDDNVVLVRFYGGVPECYGANATVVTQDDSTVKIRLETGSRPDAGDIACIEMAQAQELSVTLDDPVGDREIVAASPH